MSDVKCVVCGEPWEYWGLRDMLAWEEKLFRAGAGCPSCEGKTEKPWKPEGIDDFAYGDEDEIDRINAWEDVAERPAWKRPEPEVLWTCDSCGVEVVTNPDARPGDSDCLEWHIPVKSRAHREWYVSHSGWRFSQEEITREPTNRIEQTCLCPLCTEKCEECGATLAPLVEFGDVYDKGYAFRKYPDGWKSPWVCIDCFEQLCEDCHEMPDDCTCPSCARCGERAGEEKRCESCGVVVRLCSECLDKTDLCDECAQAECEE